MPIFTERLDRTVYHMCDLPGHFHFIPVLFKTCYERHAYTWEGRYSWLSLPVDEPHSSFYSRR